MYKKELLLSTGEKLTITNAVPEDAEAFVRHMNAAGGESDFLSIEKNGFAFNATEERIYIRTIERPSFLFVARVGRETTLAGEVSVAGEQRHRMRHVGELGITVAKKHWGKGVGTALMQAAIEHARLRGLQILQLSVRADNHAAIHIYEKCGFEAVGCMHAYMLIDGVYYDMLLMELDMRDGF